MPAQVGDIVQANCSQCKENLDVEVVAAVGAEIVTVTCKTCGTSQRYRPPQDARAKAGGRRVVDVGSTESPRPRGRSTRRVLSSTGREIIDEGPRPPMPREVLVAASQGTTAPRTFVAAPKNDDLYKRWEAMTAGVLSRHGRPHRSHESYREGEVVLHTIHGMGVVEQVASDGRLTVLFMRGYQELTSRPKAADAKV
jgi:hypothetical protein